VAEGRASTSPDQLRVADVESPFKPVLKPAKRSKSILLFQVLRSTLPVAHLAASLTNHNYSSRMSVSRPQPPDDSRRQSPLRRL
jgi:hypothetical protein